MQLTPLLKFLIVAAYVVIQVAGWIWLGIKVDLFALDFNENVYNIVAVVIGSLNTAAGGLVVFLGLKSPVRGEEVREIDDPE